jgi:hypothetical protein
MIDDRVKVAAENFRESVGTGSTTIHDRTAGKITSTGERGKRDSLAEGTEVRFAWAEGAEDSSLEVGGEARD